jgi:hypothetical protein
MQLGIEADRSKREPFKEIARRVLVAAEMLAGNGKADWPAFRATVAAAASECKKEAEAAGEQGATFAYIADELRGILPAEKK